MNTLYNTYNQCVKLALQKGYLPRWGKTLTLRRNFTEEDILVKLTPIAKWLRDVHNLYFDIANTLGEEYKTLYYLFSIDHINSFQPAIFEEIEIRFNTYEEAYTYGVLETLKLI